MNTILASSKYLNLKTSVFKILRIYHGNLLLTFIFYTYVPTAICFFFT